MVNVYSAKDYNEMKLKVAKLPEVFDDNPIILVLLVLSNFEEIWSVH